MSDSLVRAICGVCRLKDLRRTKARQHADAPTSSSAADHGALRRGGPCPPTSTQRRHLVDGKPPTSSYVRSAVRRQHG